MFLIGLQLKDHLRCPSHPVPCSCGSCSRPVEQPLIGIFFIWFSTSLSRLDQPRSKHAYAVFLVQSYVVSTLSLRKITSFPSPIKIKSRKLGGFPGWKMNIMEAWQLRGAVIGHSTKQAKTVFCPARWRDLLLTHSWCPMLVKSHFEALNGGKSSRSTVAEVSGCHLILSPDN